MYRTCTCARGTSRNLYKMVILLYKRDILYNCIREYLRIVANKANRQLADTHIHMHVFTSLGPTPARRPLFLTQQQAAQVT